VYNTNGALLVGQIVTPPGVPTNLIASADNASATISFTPPTNTGGNVTTVVNGSIITSPAVITGYTATAYLGGVSTGLTASNASSPINFSGLTNGSTYTFTVYATNSAGSGDNSAPSGPVTPATTPGAPIIISAVAGDGSVVVSFNAPSDTGGSPISSYNLTVYDGATEVLEIAGNLPSITASGLTNGTTYSFIVQAVNGVGEGSASQTVTAMPSSTPTAPLNLVLTPGDGQITCIYSPPQSNGGLPISTYTVYWSVSNTMDPSSNFSCNLTNITIEGLINATDYYFQVSASNADGAGPLTSITGPLAPINSNDAAPSNVVAITGNSVVNLEWDAPTSPAGTFSSYTINPYLSGGTPQPTITGLAATPLTYSFEAGVVGSSYYFTVTANSTGGSGPYTYTSPNSNTAVFATLPGSPIDINTVSGNGTMTVNFTAPTNDGGSAVYNYIATTYYSGGASTGFTETNTSSPIIFNLLDCLSLSAGIEYFFGVAAINIAGTGVADVYVPGTYYTISDPPTNVQASAGNASANVSWDAPVITGGTPILNYTVYATDTTTSLITNNEFDLSPANYPGLTNGTSYTFQVQANNIAGGSNYSTPSNAVTPVAPPDAPTNIVISPDDSYVDITFDTVTGATSYTANLYSSPTQATGISMNGSSSPIPFTDLTNGTSYWFTIQANNSGGSSPESSVQGPVTPYSAPDPPLNVMGVAGNGQATVSFEPSPNDGGYPVVYYTVYTYENGNQIASDNIGLNTSIVITGLKNEVAYTFTATATSILPANTDQISVTDTYLTSIESVPSDPVIPIIVGFTTNPSPYFQNNYATLTYYNTNLNTTDYYVIKDIYGNNISSEATYAYGAPSTTFPNFILHTSGLVTIYIFDLTTGQIVDVLEIDVQDVCFKEGTQILCCIDKKEKYVPIEKIQEGTFVKVYDRSDSITRGRATYKKVTYIVKNSIFNSEKHTINKLYKLSKEKNPRLIDDLYVTGSHALLHSALSDDEHEKMENLIKYYNSYQINIENREEMTDEEIEHFESMVKYYNDYTPMIQDKYKLIAYFDEDFEEICDNQNHNIYHIALENADKSANYAIYANGVLAETIPESGLYRMKYIDSINEKKAKSLLKPDYITERLNKYAKDKTRVEKIQKEVTKLVENVEKVEDVIVQQLGNRKNKSIRRVKTLLKRKTQRQIM